MSKMSKDKGKTFEREVAKFLSNTYDSSFTRVPQSGAYVGGMNSFRKESLGEAQIKSFKGDIHPPTDWDYFNCECKFYADFPFHQIFIGKVPKLHLWIKQVYDTEDANDVNIIFMKFNRKGRWVCFENLSNFVIDRGIKYDYHGRTWTFCAWEEFWTDTNVAILEHLSIHGTNSSSKVA